MDAWDELDKKPVADMSYLERAVWAYRSKGAAADLARLQATVVRAEAIEEAAILAERKLVSLITSPGYQQVVSETGRVNAKVREVIDILAAVLTSADK